MCLTTAYGPDLVGGGLPSVFEYMLSCLRCILSSLGCGRPVWGVDVQFGVWMSSLGCGHPVWGVDVRFGVWTSSLGCGHPVWGVDVQFGVWTSSLGCGRPVWGVDVQFGVWTSSLGCGRPVSRFRFEGRDHALRRYAEEVQGLQRDEAARTDSVVSGVRGAVGGGGFGVG